MVKTSFTQIEQEVVSRFDQKMALGESRHAKKQAARASESAYWKIHSQSTRKVYQVHLFKFVRWCSQQGFHSLAQIESQSDELVSRYLGEKILSEKASTVKSERSALRLFFENANLGASIIIR
jgi:site-specific recombinase XerD